MALDVDGYPDDADLDRIKNFDLLAGVPERLGREWHKNIADLLTLVAENWRWGFRVNKSGTVRLATGGWSGNEDVLDALQRNVLFQGEFWHMSRRGGLTIFRIPRGAAAIFMDRQSP